MKIIVVEGLDCSGKTTYIEEVLLKKYPAAQVVNYQGIPTVQEKVSYMGEWLFQTLKMDYLGTIDDDYVLIFDRGIASTFFYDNCIQDSGASKGFLPKVVIRMFAAATSVECHFVEVPHHVLIGRLDEIHRDEIEDLLFGYIFDDPGRLNYLNELYKVNCKHFYSVEENDLIIINGDD